MTLIPEAQFERMAVGTPCMDSDGKRFTVLGMVSHEEFEQQYQEKHMFELKHNFQNEGAMIVGLFYDPTSPDQQDIVMQSSHCVRTLIDLDSEHEIAGAKESLFHDSAVIKKLIKFVTEERNPKVSQEAFELIKTFFMRGLFATMRALGPSYVSFLQGLGLGETFTSTFTRYLLNMEEQTSSDKPLVDAT